MAPSDDPLLPVVREGLVNDTWASKMMARLHNTSLSPEDRKELENFEIRDGLIYFQGLLYVPDGVARLQVLQHRHDARLAGHFGIRKTADLVARDYWWPQQWKFVRDFVRSCDTCARSKAPRHRPYGFLQPLPIPFRPWASLTMDFITDLPLSDGFDTIMVIVERMTKMSHFIPCHKTITAEQTADLFIHHVLRLHGLPEEVISDRGPQFVAKFWKRMLELLGVTLKLSSAFHPQTDGQTERVNQVLEQYLRCTVDYQQVNWNQLLPMAEFAYNNTVQVSTGMSPFHANYGYHPRLDFQQTSEVVVPSAEERVRQLQTIHANLQQELSHAQAKYKEFADRKRMEPPPFQPGQQVWLLRRNIKTTRPSDKLDYKRIGPFVVDRQINPVAYRLLLTHNMRIHPVFHVSLLEPYHASTIPGRTQPPPPPVEVDGNMEFEVDEIVDSKIVRRKLFYLIKWVGYGLDEFSWQSASNVAHAHDEVTRFHLRFPLKPTAANIPPLEQRRAARGHRCAGIPAPTPPTAPAPIPAPASAPMPAPATITVPGRILRSRVVPVPAPPGSRRLGRG
jgi:hypothetical protein